MTPIPHSAALPPYQPPTQAKLPSRRSQRWMLLTPLLALIVLAGLMGAIIWYLTAAEESQREQALRNDVDSTQRSIREKLERNEGELTAFSLQFQTTPSAQSLQRFAQIFFSKNPEIAFLGWIDNTGIVRHAVPTQDNPIQNFGAAGSPATSESRRSALRMASSTKKPTYSVPVTVRSGDVNIDYHVPLIQEAESRGTLVATYSLQSLLLSAIPTELGNRVAFSLIDEKGRWISQTRDSKTLIGKPFHEVGLDPLTGLVKLRGYNTQPTNFRYNDVITILIVGLVLLGGVTQIVIWRNTRTRVGVERALAEETAFRRAMENSMSTGMRVIDLAGRITYVNPAFCRMVGYSTEELTGSGPPYPYWPAQTQAMLKKNLERMLTGESPPSGLPINIRRKDGSNLIVRMYTSPLIDQTGKQTGWMTSVTDISEQTRIRQELAQAQERFITVLQALDAAVSVAPPSPDDELLFANQAYKKWFGNTLSSGHRALCDTSVGPWADIREIYSPLAQRWFEVRMRNIQWVDGRAVELMVATDITQERANEQAQREQYDRLQQTARLVTMGEMASSLAHELNQPLTAIANYTSGAVSRLRLAQSKNEQIPNEDLIDLLGKTARQAERAGQVIRRIRSFVKRNDPIRKPTEARLILAESIGLAEIDARERGIDIVQEIDNNLPLLNVDPILIEQVLLNLVKNGLESMKDSPHRSLVVQVGMGDQQVIFSVLDRGHGVEEEMQEKLFDSFYTTKPDGMGMGLNICRSIIESHQGRLWFENNPEGGCTFRFTLPVLPANLASNLLMPTEGPRT
ncbi:PAS domain [Burkholderiales bacterium]